jgi:hypothetical protein
MRISTLLGLVFLLALKSLAQGAAISSGGSTLGATSAPPPGTLGYVYYAMGQPDESNSTTPVGLSAPGTLASPAPFVSIDTTGDQFFTSSTSFGGYANLTVAGTPQRTGVAFQQVPLGQSRTLATLSLLAGTPSSFRLGVLEDNAPGPQNNQGSITVTGANGINTSSGNGAVAANDFYFFNVTSAQAGDTITVATTNNGVSGNFSFVEIGGLTFDTIPEPASLSLLSLAALAALRRR